MHRSPQGITSGVGPLSRCYLPKIHALEASPLKGSTLNTGEQITQGVSKGSGGLDLKSGPRPVAGVKKIHGEKFLHPHLRGQSIGALLPKAALVGTVWTSLLAKQSSWSAIHVHVNIW